MTQLLRVNSDTYEVDIEPDTPLLWVLRDTLGLTGTKFGCGEGVCGACTVQIDGKVARSCLTELRAVAGHDVTTIEHFGNQPDHPVITAWIDEQVPQCGYCQSGQIMMAEALLRNNPRPTDSDIDRTMINICRCGTYAEIRKAIRVAADRMLALAKKG